MYNFSVALITKQTKYTIISQSVKWYLQPFNKFYQSITSDLRAICQY